MREKRGRRKDLRETHEGNNEGRQERETEKVRTERVGASFSLNRADICVRRERRATTSLDSPLCIEKERRRERRGTRRDGACKAITRRKHEARRGRNQHALSLRCLQQSLSGCMFCGAGSAAHLEQHFDRRGQLLEQIISEDIHHSVENAHDPSAEEGAAWEGFRNAKRGAERSQKRRTDLLRAGRRNERGVSSDSGGTPVVS